MPQDITEMIYLMSVLRHNVHNDESIHGRS